MADALVAWVPKPSTRGGMWVEVGFALGRGIRVVVVADADEVLLPVFTDLPVIVRVPAMAGAAAQLRRWAGGGEDV